MSSFNRVVISEGETGADAPLAADQSADSAAKLANNLSAEGDPSTDATSVQAEGGQAGDRDGSSNGGDRPEWLPEKFKSPEELAKAYNELQKKLSQPKAEEPKKEETPKPEEGEEGSDAEKEGESPKLDGRVDLTPFHNEWAEKGELSPDSFSKLEKMGFPKELVQQYINGFQASQAQEAQSIYRETGGEEGYKAMTEWASKNLSAQEIAAYDNLVTSGDVNAAKIAAKGLYAQYVAANGQPPKLISGTPSSKSSLSPFRSTSEVVAAMSDPRYKNDPAFRKDVERRLAQSDVF